MVRCTILAGNVDELQILSEIFRPCSNPNVIRYRNEFNGVNPDKGGIRRLQVNLALPEADGHVAEILVFYGPSADKYDLSRAAYGIKRSADDAAARSEKRPGNYEATVIAGKLSVKAEETRRQANEEAANFPEVRSLTMSQRAYEINQFPVIVNEDGREGQRFALVPNPVSGLWETDQRFLDVIDHPENYDDVKVLDSNIFDARVRAEALCRSENLKTELSL